jgi:hypothetical protein
MIEISDEALYKLNTAIDEGDQMIQFLAEEVRKWIIRYNEDKKDGLFNVIVPTQEEIIYDCEQKLGMLPVPDMDDSEEGDE